MPTDEPDLSRLQEVTPEATEQSFRDLFDAEVTAFEIDAVREQAATAEELTARQREEIEDLRQDRGQRKMFSYLIFGLVSAWLAAVLSIVIVIGASEDSFKLHEVVLTTLIGTTTASVLGLFLVVARYLFPRR